MSCYDDNCVNDNRMNGRPSQQLKHLLKPLLRLLKRGKHRSTYRKSPQPDFYVCEAEDNLANEILENTILEEIARCPEGAGVPVYREGVMDVAPVFRGERYVPVHFAKTEAGTFFWTTMVGADHDIAYDGGDRVITGKQLPELQVARDRWAQA